MFRASGRAPEVRKTVLGESDPLSNVKGARLTRYGADEGTAAHPDAGASQREIILKAGTPAPSPPEAPGHEPGRTSLRRVARDPGDETRRLGLPAQGLPRLDALPRSRGRIAEYASLLPRGTEEKAQRLGRGVVLIRHPGRDPVDDAYTRIERIVALAPPFAHAAEHELDAGLGRKVVRHRAARIE